MDYRHERMMGFLMLILCIVIPCGAAASQALGNDADLVHVKSDSPQAISKPSIIYVTDFVIRGLIK